MIAALLSCFAALVMVALTLPGRAWRIRASRQKVLLHPQHTISRLVRRDVLTGLPTRRQLRKLLPRLLARASRNGTRVALLHVDLNPCRNVHPAPSRGVGDKLLTRSARRLRASVAAHDVLVHLGGNEFLLIATRLPEVQVVNAIADRLRTVLTVPMDREAVSTSISPSIGISVFPDDGADFEQLLKQADIALSHAKHLGGGHHQFYSPQMHPRVRERLG